MTKLPNYQDALIAREKLTDYILSLSHPIGKHKAKFLQRAGYTQQKWAKL